MKTICIFFLLFGTVFANTISGSIEIIDFDQDGIASLDITGRAAKSIYYGLDVKEDYEEINKKNLLYLLTKSINDIKCLKLVDANNNAHYGCEIELNLIDGSVTPRLLIDKF
jgi:hypothetical protein